MVVTPDALTPDPIDALASTRRRARVAKVLRGDDMAVGRPIRPLRSYLDLAADVLRELDEDINDAEVRAVASRRASHEMDDELVRARYPLVEQEIRADALLAAVRFWHGDPHANKSALLVTADQFARYIRTGER